MVLEIQDGLFVEMSDVSAVQRANGKLFVYAQGHKLEVTLLKFEDLKLWLTQKNYRKAELAY